MDRHRDRFKCVAHDTQVNHLSIYLLKVVSCVKSWGLLGLTVKNSARGAGVHMHYTCHVRTACVRCRGFTGVCAQWRGTLQHATLGPTLGLTQSA